MPRSPFRHISLLTALAVLLLLALVWPLVKAQVSLSFERDRMRIMLDQISRDIERNFYDPDLRGLDWRGMVQQTRARIESSNQASEMVTAIFALVNRLNDSHTTFIPPAWSAKIRFGFEAKPYGDQVLVYEVRKDSAAERAGLKLGDRIHQINGFPVDRESWDLMMVYFRRLRPVTAMEIVYSRQDSRPQTMRIDADIERQQAIEDLTKLETVYKYIREAESQKEVFRYGNFDGGIGFLQMPSFMADQEFLQRLVREVRNARAVVIDLRGNPGGSLELLREFIGFFEPENTILAKSVERRKENLIRIRARKPHLAGPMFILVDSQSGSAAEVFARHFQRNGRGKVIGDRTAGRVTIARVFPSQVGTDVVAFFGVQVAIGRLVFPDGEELEGKGVTPDRFCVPTGDQLREGLDPCRSAAFAMARETLGLAPQEKPGEEPGTR